jgi:hypothetical protein
LNTRAIWRALLSGAVFLAVITAGAQRAERQIYSDVYFNEEGGDLLGTELDLVVGGRDVSGSLRIYQGGCATPSAVRGTLFIANCI